MKLPTTVFPPATLMRIPFAAKLLMTSARTVLAPAVIRRPLAPDPARLPSISTMGDPMKPLCVVPSITTGPVITGSAVVGLMLGTPLMLKMIVSVPGFAFAALMASRRLQWVASQVPSSTSSAEFTTKVAVVARAGAASAPLTRAIAETSAHNDAACRFIETLPIPAGSGSLTRRQARRQADSRRCRGWCCRR